MKYWLWILLLGIGTMGAHAKDIPAFLRQAILEAQPQVDDFDLVIHTPIPSAWKDVPLQLSQEVTFDDKQSTFEAIFLWEPGVGERQTLSVNGKIIPVREIPVVSRTIPRGHVIQEPDIDFKRIPTTHIRSGTVLEVEDLIGLAPRGRALAPNIPIAAHTLQKPAVVKKNDVVEVIYKSGPLQISRRMIAQKDGGKSDVIAFKPIENAQHRKTNINDTVFATIIGEQRAEVRLGESHK